MTRLSHLHLPFSFSFVLSLLYTTLLLSFHYSMTGVECNSKLVLALVNTTVSNGSPIDAVVTPATVNYTVTVYNGSPSTMSDAPNVNLYFRLINTTNNSSNMTATCASLGTVVHSTTVYLSCIYTISTSEPAYNHSIALFINTTTGLNSGSVMEQYTWLVVLPSTATPTTTTSATITTQGGLLTVLTSILGGGTTNSAATTLPPTTILPSTTEAATTTSTIIDTTTLPPDTTLTPTTASPVTTEATTSPVSTVTVTETIGPTTTLTPSTTSEVPTATTAPTTLVSPTTDAVATSMTPPVTTSAVLDTTLTPTITTSSTLPATTLTPSTTLPSTTDTVAVSTMLPTTTTAPVTSTPDITTTLTPGSDIPSTTDGATSSTPAPTTDPPTCTLTPSSTVASTTDLVTTTSASSTTTAPETTSPPTTSELSTTTTILATTSDSPTSTSTPTTPTNPATTTTLTATTSPASTASTFIVTTTDTPTTTDIPTTTLPPSTQIDTTTVTTTWMETTTDVTITLLTTTTTIPPTTTGTLLATTTPIATTTTADTTIVPTTTGDTSLPTTAIEPTSSIMSATTSTPASGWCPSTMNVPCPINGRSFYYCTAGSAINGCSENNAFPPGACSAQCLWNSNGPNATTTPITTAPSTTLATTTNASTTTTSPGTTTVVITLPPATTSVQATTVSPASTSLGSTTSIAKSDPSATVATTIEPTTTLIPPTTTEATTTTTPATSGTLLPVTTSAIEVTTTLAPTTDPPTTTLTPSTTVASTTELVTSTAAPSTTSAPETTSAETTTSLPYTTTTLATTSDPPTSTSTPSVTESTTTLAATSAPPLTSTPVSTTAMTSSDTPNTTLIDVTTTAYDTTTVLLSTTTADVTTSSVTSTADTSTTTAQPTMSLPPTTIVTTTATEAMTPTPTVTVTALPTTTTPPPATATSSVTTTVTPSTPPPTTSSTTLLVTTGTPTPTTPLSPEVPLSITRVDPEVILCSPNTAPAGYQCSGGQLVTLYGSSALYSLTDITINEIPINYTYQKPNTLHSFSHRRKLLTTSDPSVGVLYFYAPPLRYAMNATIELHTQYSRVMVSTYEYSLKYQILFTPDSAVPSNNAGSGSGEVIVYHYPSIVELTPSSVSQVGGDRIVIYGSYLYSIGVVTMNGTVTTPDAVESVSKNKLYNVILYMKAPSTNYTGYLPITIVSGGDASTYVYGGTSTVYIYYTATNCPEGTWLPYNKAWLYGCEPCPKGGYCPGGGRVWPVTGYWSYNEFSPPIQCNMGGEACPGAASMQASQAVYNTDGSRVTSICTDAYTGDKCSECSADHFKLIDKCQTCGSTALDLISMILVIGVALTLFTIIAIAVVCLSPTSLSSFVGNIIVVQQFITLAQLALQKLPGNQSSFTMFVNALSGINFDVQLIKPGCMVGKMSFLTLFWATAGIMCVASVLFTLAAYIRARLIVRKHQLMRQQEASAHQHIDNNTHDTNDIGNGYTNRIRPSFTGIIPFACSDTDIDKGTATGDTPPGHTADTPPITNTTTTTSIHNGADTKKNGDQATPPVSSSFHLTKEFIHRLISSQYILGCLIYLRLTTYILQALHCIDVPDPQGTTLSLLKADMQTRCYEGNHLVSAPFIWLLLIFYTGGFPALCAWRLYQNFHPKKIREKLSTLQKASTTSSTATAAPVKNHDEMMKPYQLQHIPDEQVASTHEAHTPPQTQKKGGISMNLEFIDPQWISDNAASPVNTLHRRTPYASHGDTYSTYPYVSAKNTSQKEGENHNQNESIARSSNDRASEKQSGIASMNTKKLTTLLDTSFMKADEYIGLQSIQKKHTFLNDSPVGTSAAQKSVTSTDTADTVKPHTPPHADVPPVSLVSESHDRTEALHAFYEQRAELYGFLFRKLKKKYYYYRLLTLLCSFSFAINSTYTSDPSYRIFAPSIIFGVQLAVLSSVLPFDRWFRNGINIGVCMIGIIQSILYLAIINNFISTQDLPLPNTASTGQTLQNTDRSVTSILLYSVGAIVGAVVILVLSVNLKKFKTKVCRLKRWLGKHMRARGRWKCRWPTKKSSIVSVVPLGYQTEKNNEVESEKQHHKRVNRRDKVKAVLGIDSLCYNKNDNSIDEEKKCKAVHESMNSSSTTQWDDSSSQYESDDEDEEEGEENEWLREMNEDLEAMRQEAEANNNRHVKTSGASDDAGDSHIAGASSRSQDADDHVHPHINHIEFKAPTEFASRCASNNVSHDTMNNTLANPHPDHCIANLTSRQPNKTILAPLTHHTTNTHPFPSSSSSTAALTLLQKPIPIQQRMSEFQLHASHSMIQDARTTQDTSVSTAMPHRSSSRTPSAPSHMELQRRARLTTYTSQPSISSKPSVRPFHHSYSNDTFESHDEVKSPHSAIDIVNRSQDDLDLPKQNHEKDDHRTIDTYRTLSRPGGPHSRHTGYFSFRDRHVSPPAHPHQMTHSLTPRELTKRLYSPHRHSSTTLSPAQAYTPPPHTKGVQHHHSIHQNNHNSNPTSLYPLPPLRLKTLATFTPTSMNTSTHHSYQCISRPSHSVAPADNTVLIPTRLTRRCLYPLVTAYSIRTTRDSDDDSDIHVDPENMTIIPHHLQSFRSSYAQDKDDEGYHPSAATVYESQPLTSCDLNEEVVIKQSEDGHDEYSYDYDHNITG